MKLLPKDIIIELYDYKRENTSERQRSKLKKSKTNQMLQPVASNTEKWLSQKETFQNEKKSFSFLKIYNAMHVIHLNIYTKKIVKNEMSLQNRIK